MEFAEVVHHVEDDVVGIEYSGRDYKKPTAEYWKSNLLHKIQAPAWQNWGDHDLPLLAAPQDLGSIWPIAFGGTDERRMDTFAFETRPGSTVKYIGVAVPKSCTPDAYLLVFRHSAKDKDYPGGNGLLAKGVGDYLTGRMQISQQISVSRTNVAAVVPIAVGGSGEFENSEKFVTQCLNEIERELFAVARPLPPLLLSSNSDGIIKMNNFLANCTGLRSRVKAIYDFDGSRVIAARGITLTGVKGAQVFRYDGLGAMPRINHESDAAYLARTMNSNPARVPLSITRWRSHFRYNGEKDENWLHHFIPTCMLQHGLVSTSCL